MSGVILQYVCIFMSVCSAVCILHYLHVTAAQLYSLSPLTSIGLSVDCTGTNLWGCISATGMSSQTQSLRLAGERAGRWNEVGEWGNLCYNYYLQAGVQINCYNNKLPT